MLNGVFSTAVYCFILLLSVYFVLLNVSFDVSLFFIVSSNYLPSNKYTLFSSLNYISTLCDWCPQETLLTLLYCNFIDNGIRILVLSGEKITGNTGNGGNVISLRAEANLELALFTWNISKGLQGLNNLISSPWRLSGAIELINNGNWTTRMWMSL